MSSDDVVLGLVKEMRRLANVAESLLEIQRLHLELDHGLKGEADVGPGTSTDAHHESG